MTMGKAKLSVLGGFDLWMLPLGNDDVEMRCGEYCHVEILGGLC